MVKFYSEKLKFSIFLCVLWSLKLVLSRMATKLPFLVLFWFLCSGNATNLFVGSSYSSCWTTKMLVLIWRLLVGNVRLLNSKPTLQWKIQKREDSNQGSYMITLSLEFLTSKFSNFGHFFKYLLMRKLMRGCSDKKCNQFVSSWMRHRFHSKI